MKINFYVFLLSLLSFSFAHAENFTINSCPATTDLFDHISEQIDDRIEGVTASDLTKSIFSTRGNLTSPWVYNPNVWTNNDENIDFTGMSPWNSRGGYTRAGTLITPRHIALANHYALSFGDTVLFVASDNTIVTRTVSSVERVLSTDISIAKLSSDVPDTITHYPILDKTELETYLSDGFDMSTYNIPIVVFDQEDKALIKDTSKNYPLFSSGIVHNRSIINNRADFNETIIGGDSGNAGFALIGDKPVLSLTHYYDFSGPSYSYYRQDIQDVIDDMGGEHQLSTIDLDCFNAPIVLENNTTLNVIENGQVGTSVGTTSIKYNIENDTPYFSILSGNDDGALSISSSTGEITIASSTLAQNPHFPRTIEIAVEEGLGGRMSKNSYTINLATYPYFGVQDYSFDIDEHSSNGTIVGTIQANDEQDDALEYSIVSGNTDGIFAINSSTGVITIADSTLLNYETESSHELVVRAKEGETIEELSSTIEITIAVNDISYEFSQENYFFEIDELDENETVVGTVDSDIVDALNINSTYYQIIAGNTDGIFSISSSTGQITIEDNEALDGNNIYNLVIGASERIDSSVLKSVPVTITATYTNRPTLSYQAQATSLVRYEVDEGTTVSMIFELSAPYTKTIVATLTKTSGSATANTDYSLSTDTLTFLPGETSKTVTFSALTDSTNENDETVLLNILDNNRVTYGIRKNATITINNVAPVSSRGGGGSGSSKKKESENNLVLTETSSITPITIVPRDNFTPAQSIMRTLKQGDFGNDVKSLQIILNILGYTISITGPGSQGNETTLFGPLTTEALIKYQTENNISPAIGYFGPITQQSIITKLIALFLDSA